MRDCVIGKIFASLLNAQHAAINYIQRLAISKENQRDFLHNIE